MQKKITILTFVASCILFGCKTVQINKTAFKTTDQNIQLVNIGSESNSILENSFQNSAIIHLKKNIRVSVSFIPFNNKTYKAYKSVNPSSKLFSVTYNDSMPKKPRFVTLSVMDQVVLLDELNSKYNKSIKSYIENTTKTNIITEISLVIKPQDLEALLSAEAIFLVQDGQKNHVLSLQNENQPDKVIKFSDAVTFGYKSASFCWQEDDKHQLNIVAFANGINGCPQKTYRSTKRAKEKVNYYKL